MTILTYSQAEKAFSIVFHSIDNKSDKSDVKIYLEFMRKVYDLFNLDIPSEGFNITEITQNSMQSQNHGRETIRELCKWKFFEIHRVHLS